MGHVTLRKGGFVMRYVTLGKGRFIWDMSHRGRDGLHGMCHIEEGTV